MATEIIKTNIEAGYGDRIEVGRVDLTTPADRPPVSEMVYQKIDTLSDLAVIVYFDTPKSLDDTIEALIRARKEVFGDRP